MNNIETQEKIKIEDLIYEIRGKQAMLDSDLAKLYGCKNGTKTINQSVHRNIERFPIDFYFQLTDLEFISLRSQIGTSSSNNYGGRRTLPYVFTEQGVAMIATILKTNIAAEMSISIMRAFVAMRHYIGNNLLEQKYVNNLVLENKESINKINTDIKLLQESFNKFEEKRKINEIYFNGQIFDAYSKIKVIFNNTFHDRCFILDNSKIYHCGSSINRIGYKTFSITLISDKEVCNSLINNINTLI